MESRNKAWIGVVLVIVIIAIVIGFAQHKKTAVDVSQKSGPVTTINAAALLSLTGDAAADSQQMERGIDLAKMDLAKEGITLNMDIEDDNTDPVKSVTALQKIISTEKPEFLIGPSWSFLGSADSDLIVDNNIPDFQPADTSEFVISKSYKQLFFGSPKVAYKQPLVEQFLKENNVKSVLILDDTDDWGTTHKEMFDKAVADAGVNVVGDVQLPVGQFDTIVPVLAKYKNQKIDAILWSGYEEGASLLLQKYKQYGYTSLILGDRAMLGDTTYDAAKENGKVSMIVTSHTAEFVAKYKAVYGTDPNPYADSAYDGVMMMVQAIQKVGDDPNAMIAYLKNPAFSYKGYHTTYQFDDHGDFQNSTWLLQKVQ